MMECDESNLVKLVGIGRTGLFANQFGIFKQNENIHIFFFRAITFLQISDFDVKKRKAIHYIYFSGITELKE